MKTGYKVYDAMTQKPVVLGPNANLQTCAKVMAKQHVGAILIKQGQKVKGILTEQDIVRKVVAKGINPLKMKVKNVMEKKLVTITPDKDIFEALVKMRDLNIRHLPVIDKGKFIGLLTLKDILKIQPQLFDLLVEKFELREESRKPINLPLPREGICQACGNYSDKISTIDGVMLCPRCKKEQKP